MYYKKMDITIFVGTNEPIIEQLVTREQFTSYRLLRKRAKIEVGLGSFERSSWVKLSRTGFTSLELSANAGSKATSESYLEWLSLPCNDCTSDFG